VVGQGKPCQLALLTLLVVPGKVGHDLGVRLQEEGSAKRKCRPGCSVKVGGGVAGSVNVRLNR